MMEPLNDKSEKLFEDQKDSLHLWGSSAVFAGQTSRVCLPISIHRSVCICTKDQTKLLISLLFFIRFWSTNMSLSFPKADADV